MKEQHGCCNGAAKSVLPLQRLSLAAIVAIDAMSGRKAARLQTWCGQARCIVDMEAT